MEKWVLWVRFSWYETKLGIKNVQCIYMHICEGGPKLPTVRLHTTALTLPAKS